MKRVALCGVVLVLWMLLLIGLAFLFNRNVDISLAARAESTREAKALAVEVGAWER